MCFFPIHSVRSTFLIMCQNIGKNGECLISETVAIFDNLNWDGKRTEEVAIQISKFRSRSPPITVIIDAHHTNYSEKLVEQSTWLPYRWTWVGWIFQGFGFQSRVFCPSSKKWSRRFNSNVSAKGVGEKQASEWMLFFCESGKFFLDWI